MKLKTDNDVHMGSIVFQLNPATFINLNKYKIILTIHRYVYTTSGFQYLVVVTILYK